MRMRGVSGGSGVSSAAQNSSCCVLLLVCKSRQNARSQACCLIESKYLSLSLSLCPGCRPSVRGIRKHSVIHFN